MDQKTINYVGLSLIIILIAGLIFSTGSIRKNKKSLKQETAVSELRLSEKQKISEELEKLNSDYSGLKSKFDSNEKLIAEYNTKITETEKRINSLSVENRTLRASKNELAELARIKATLESEKNQLKSELDNLSAQNRDLQNSLNTLKEEKTKEALLVEKAKQYDSDNFLVTATRGKKTEKVVIFASRAKKLNIAFEVPQSLTENISFRIVTPSGETINPDNKSMSWYFPFNHNNLTASLSGVSGEFEASRKVILNYSPDKKLARGEYKIQVMSGGNNIGNCRLMLR